MSSRNDKLNWVVAGIGDITTNRVIPAIESERRSVLYGVVSRDRAKGSRYAGRVWEDLEGALADPGVDAVYIATPVFLHAPQTIAALGAGKHVLCEKPVAMNYREACRMTSAARETGKKLGVSYYRRMYAKVRRARELIEAGAIGRPVLAEFLNHDWWQDEDARRAWKLDPATAGGGPLYDIASHRIDLLNFYFGKPVRACGQLSNVVHTMSKVEDSATLLVDYEGGARGVVDVRWHSRVPRDEMRIIGVEGEMSLTPLNGPELTYCGRTENLPAPANLHYPCIENFVSAVMDGAYLESSGESAIWTDWVTEQVMSRDTGTGGFRNGGQTDS
jgi:predicted dehydrogenase